MFSRQHYEALARVFREADAGRQSEREAACVMFGPVVQMLTADNPRFDVERFRRAASAN